MKIEQALGTVALASLTCLSGCGEADTQAAPSSGAAGAADSDPAAELVTPEEAQAEADEEIDASNADAAFEELKRQIESDG